MRILIALPLLALAACQVTTDDKNDSVTASFNEDVAENAASDIGNFAEDVANDVGNTAEDVGNRAENWPNWVWIDRVSPLASTIAMLAP